MPTTRSLRRRHRAGLGRLWPVAAPIASALPTCRCSRCAPIWSTAISPGRSGRGSRPASSLGISVRCPNRPSAAAATVAVRSAVPPRSKRRHHQAGQRSDHPHPRQPPKRIVVAAKPRAFRRNEHIGCSRRLQEPRVGSVGAARPRRRRQHHPTREPGQQRQPSPASPPGRQFVRDEPPDSPHWSRLRTAHSTSQGACSRRGGEGGTTVQSCLPPSPPGRVDGCARAARGVGPIPPGPQAAQQQAR